MKKIIDKLFRWLGYAPIEYLKHNTFYEQTIYDIKEIKHRAVMQRKYEADLNMSSKEREDRIREQIKYELTKRLEHFFYL